MVEKFVNNYFKKLNLINSKLPTTNFELFIDLLKKIKKNNKKVVFAGNGGSAAMASHVSVDFSKVCKIRSINFNEADLITCYANDYGYNNWITEALKSHADKDDLVVLISSSGKSENIVNAGKYCNKKKIKLVTFSGFKKNNPLKKLGKLNFWVNSREYNIVEMTHHVWILMAVDFLSNKNV
tara:strand:- start:981 stop:1526 length:546 start_codon:yes stop_codon:yes gene_type:complete